MTFVESSQDEFVSRLSKETLKDIEGLDPLLFGFGREECCGPLPDKLPGSIAFKEHVFLSTNLTATQWDAKTGNVPGYTALEKAVNSEGGKKLTVYYRPGPDTCILRFKYEESLASLLITQYSCITEEELPWESNGAVSCDRSNELFVFVCSHRSRDHRCGYCGAVLVDLLRQSIKARKGDDESIHVYPCSHVGGHVYAGNVLLYSKHGGVCFGCFTPAQVKTFVDFLVGGAVEIPASLKQRIRGHIGYTNVDSKCCVM
ncbi:sucraseferredoxin-like family protein [Trypanosoma rangeli]|uniref:Sucraseferredoxin-like family protein n=1 Tax=Trypanosoma rangeli TaxID=5698 RepID=A0A422NAD6_TRYRA|nr:sucraseferredoxin-like family protein [Trypanosoma rangeli]RNF02392.1 sucraseferredoxin-like family protein [Trypanosoma rangeli]|eukprot:RNF02392.1 sucraseferredoxin-like family protein [Trypanosoma rangeli]